MKDFVRVFCAVPALRVGDVRYNAEQIAAAAEKAEAAGADVLVFPELGLTGYTCADLFFQQTLQREALTALGELARRSAEWGFVAVVGLPVAADDALYNCAAVLAGGKIRGVVPKIYLPNYNEFYEKRWFVSGADARIDALPASLFGLEGEDVPFGHRLIFDVGGNVRMAAEICEDLWVPIPPGTRAALAGAELIVNLSAGNETVGKREFRRELVRMQSARNLCAYAYCSAGAGESTTDVIFPGHALLCEGGRVAAENPEFITEETFLTAEFDLGRIRADRAKQNSFRDNAAEFVRPGDYRVISCGTRRELRGDGSLLRIKKTPFVPSDARRRRERCLNIFEMQTAALKKRLSVTGGKAVVGVSGGLDSTLALLVSAETVRRLGRPASDLVGITMPGFGTTDRTYRNALQLMKTLGAEIREINIKDACLLHFRDIGHDPDVHDLTFENTQARERTQVLMDYAGKIGGIVVGTGDLSELALGWCTYNGDQMSMYGVNAGIPKTLVRWMVEGIAESDLFPESREVLRDILDTPVSPELLPPDAEGKIAQKTEDILGPYVLHDFFLYWMLRYGFSPSKIFVLAKHAFAGEYEPAEISARMKLFYRRFFSQQFKRSCMPDGVKVGSVCLSPRGDWRMPSDACAAAWLAELDALKP